MVTWSLKTQQMYNYKIAVQYVVTHYSCVTKKHMDLNCGFVQTSLKYVIS